MTITTGARSNLGPVYPIRKLLQAKGEELRKHELELKTATTELKDRAQENKILEARLRKAQEEAERNVDLSSSEQLQQAVDCQKALEGERTKLQVENRDLASRNTELMMKMQKMSSDLNPDAEESARMVQDLETLRIKANQAEKQRLDAEAQLKKAREQAEIMRDKFTKYTSRLSHLSSPAGENGTFPRTGAATQPKCKTNAGTRKPPPSQPKTQRPKW